MSFFYNLAGVVIAILALLMLNIPSPPNNEGRSFCLAKRWLTAAFLLTSLSMFAAQFEARIVYGEFEILNALMLLFFFLTGQGILFAILVLYDSLDVGRKFLTRALVPMLALFGFYAVMYLFMPDVSVYSAEEFFRLLPTQPLLMLRCVILVGMAASLLYTIILCERAKNAYRRMVMAYFSEPGIARGVWLSRLLGVAEALSVWVLLTYFYTNPMLEVLVGLFIIFVFLFYVREFREYANRYDQMRPAIQFSQADADSGSNSSVYPAEERLAAQLEQWALRADKPYAQSKVTINDVANQLGVNKRMLSRHINATNDNFCSWINAMRIEEACRLLEQQGELSISEVAECTGFCDLPAFSRAFKKAKGITPREFKSHSRG